VSSTNDELHHDKRYGIEYNMSGQLRRSILSHMFHHLFQARRFTFNPKVFSG
jgi:hypothetical protein